MDNFFLLMSSLRLTILPGDGSASVSVVGRKEVRISYPGGWASTRVRLGTEGVEVDWQVRLYMQRLSCKRADAHF